MDATSTGHAGAGGRSNSTSWCRPELIGRAIGILYGFGNQVLFLVTVWYLFWFLRDGSLTPSHGHWIVRDSALALLFAAGHSVMLVPATRRYLTRWIPTAFYDSTFCVVTCVSLLTLFIGWRSSETVLWQLDGWKAELIRGGFYFCWVALIYSLALTGLGYQNGWTPFYHWLRREDPPRREFKPRGAYKLIRHPVYLSFLGLVWFTPRMTLDHAALTAIWTGYIFYGSFLKDRRLSRFIGQPYRDYQAQVPGFPLIPGGPLGRCGGGRNDHPDAVSKAPADAPTSPVNRKAA
ncbi:methyltransferase family protein [Rhodopirellula sp. JC639]|uniref:methyltransferase family protein n=1 Tax=Stieleria mannarensis TaxID=2755585 RepID=UPI0016047128|nr:NnrU family protein [Rhodopirellula sp. JC639]